MEDRSIFSSIAVCKRISVIMVFPSFYMTEAMIASQSLYIISVSGVEWSTPAPLSQTEQLFSFAFIFCL